LNDEYLSALKEDKDNKDMKNDPGG
jgi:hypothetical protein